MTISAVTDNATLRVLFWGGDVGVPAAGAGQTRTVGIPNGDAAVVNANTPNYTKVVGSAFVAMSGGERDAVDAVLDPIADAELYADFSTTLDKMPTHDYGDIGGAVTINMGLAFRQKITLIGDLVADDITLTPSAGTRKVTLEIIQGGAGNWEIPDAAWPSNANFGSKGKPALGETAGARRFFVFDYGVGDSDVCIHYDTNIF